MAGDKIDFLLDLDSDDFASKIESAIDKVTNLQTGLGKVAVIAGVVGAAFLALKTSLDLAFQAEQIKSLEVQFENLSKQAGVSSQAILSGMNKASDGLLDAKDSMALANRAIVQLGSSSSKIPEIMELARKASIITGNSISNEFERISLAIASGQTRSLKDLGVKLDSEKAYRAYAKSIGIAANALNEEGRAAAIAATLIPLLDGNLKGVDKTIRQTTDSWVRMKIAVNDIYEAIAVVGGEGGRLTRWINGLSEAAQGFSYWIKEAFGFGEERALSLRFEISKLASEIERLSSRRLTFLETILGTGAGNNIDNAVKALREKISPLQKELDDIEAKVAEKEKEKNALSTETKVTDKGGQSDKNVELLNEQRFFSDLNTLRQADLQNRIAAEQTFDQVKANIAEQRILLDQQIQAQIAAVNNDANFSPEQRADLETQIQANKAAQLATIEESANARKIAALDRYQTHATSTADGVSKAFEAGSKKAQLEQSNFGAVGARVFNSFSTNATNAFVAFGAGQKSAAEAAKGFLFGMLADEAFARGQIMFLSSIWPPNPAGLAGGAALMAFSGFLRSQAGGTGGATGGSAVSTDGGGISNSAAQPQIATTSSEAQERKTLSIVINGNVFDSDATAMRIVEMVKEAQDATDVRITRT